MVPVAGSPRGSCGAVYAGVQARPVRKRRGRAKTRRTSARSCSERSAAAAADPSCAGASGAVWRWAWCRGRRRSPGIDLFLQRGDRPIPLVVMNRRGQVSAARGAARLVRDANPRSGSTRRARRTTSSQSTVDQITQTDESLMEIAVGASSGSVRNHSASLLLSPSSERTPLHRRTARNARTSSNKPAGRTTRSRVGTTDRAGPSAWPHSFMIDERLISVANRENGRCIGFRSAAPPG